MRQHADHRSEIKGAAPADRGSCGALDREWISVLQGELPCTTCSAEPANLTILWPLALYAASACVPVDRWQACMRVVANGAAAIVHQTSSNEFHTWAAIKLSHQSTRGHVLMTELHQVPQVTKERMKRACGLQL